MSVTDDIVGDSSEFTSLLEQVANVAEPKDENEHSSREHSTKDEIIQDKSPEPDSTGKQLQLSIIRKSPHIGRLSHCDLVGCINLDILFADAAYGSIKNVNACVQAKITPGVAHKINLTTDKDADDAWTRSVRDQLGGSPDVINLKQSRKGEPSILEGQNRP